MISKEEFIKYFKSEHKLLSRDNLYVVYQFLLTLNDKIEKEFKFSVNKIDSYSFLLNTELQEKIKKIKPWSFDIDFWNLMTNQDRKIQKERDRKIVAFFEEKTGKRKDSQSLYRYLTIILYHLIPIDDKIIKLYSEKVNQRIIEIEQIQGKRKNIKVDNGGIYGIYENDKLVYIGMTMRPFETRWKEHQDKIKEKSKELVLYELIDANAKIEFKKILIRNDMKSDSEITKRDLQAMEFALIQEHQPKYNFSGRTLPYKFNQE